MKSNFTYRVIFLMLPLLSLGQNILWERSYGGRHADYLFDVIPTADYGFILAGSSLSGQTGTKLSAGSGNFDYCLTKMDEHGGQEWQNTFGGSGTDILKSINHTADGGYILGGSSDSPEDKNKPGSCKGATDYWIIKIDGNGQETWQRTIGGSGQDDLVSVIETADGGYLAGGSSGSGKSGDKITGSNGNMDFWIVKLDNDGNTQWQQSYGGKYADLLRTMARTADGGYIVGGYSNSPESGSKTQMNIGTDGDYWILKLNNKGDVEWQQTIGGEADDQLASVLPTADKGYLIAGHSASGPTATKTKSNKKGSDFWILKLHEEGYIEWQETYNYGPNDILTSLVRNDDNTFMIGGYSGPSGGTKHDEGVNDFIALKISDKGDVLWEQTVGSEGEDILCKAIETRDGGYIMAGTSNPEYEDFEAGNSKKSKSKKVKARLGNGGQLAGAENLQNAMDEAVNGFADSVNDKVDKAVSAVTDKLNDRIGEALGQNEDSRVKLGVNAPAGKLMNIGKGGSSGEALDSAAAAMADKGPKKGLAASREKKTNYGGRDFWVVKLGDKNKAIKERSTIEVYPNPVIQFTTVVINFEYERGTIAVFDISGRQMLRSTISEKSIPLNMSAFPAGIYIIKVSTNKGEGSVKVIKNITK